MEDWERRASEKQRELVRGRKRKRCEDVLSKPFYYMNLLFVGQIGMPSPQLEKRSYSRRRKGLVERGSDYQNTATKGILNYKKVKQHSPSSPFFDAVVREASLAIGFPLILGIIQNQFFLLDIFNRGQIARGGVVLVDLTCRKEINPLIPWCGHSQKWRAVAQVKDLIS